MPGCVEELGWNLVNTVQGLRGAAKTNQDVKEGIVQYIRAKRFRRAQNVSDEEVEKCEDFFIIP